MSLGVVLRQGQDERRLCHPERSDGSPSREGEQPPSDEGAVEGEYREV